MANSNDGVVKHAGWMSGSPSMDQGSGLSPDWEGLGGSADSSPVKSAGQTMGSTPMTQSPGEITTRIMEEGIDYTFPGSDQGNLEHTGPAVKGA